jgi:ankyrin repeat protein
LLFQSSVLSGPNSRNRDIGSDIDRLSSAIYRIANGDVRLTAPGKPLEESLEVVFNLTPKHVLLKILESDSATVRVATEKLVEYSSTLCLKSDFTSLIEVVMRFHPKWLHASRYLVFAAHVGCAYSCGILLHNLPYLNDNPLDLSFTTYYIKAFGESVAGGGIECTQLLFKNAIDTNTTRLYRDESLLTKIFGHLLQIVVTGRVESLMTKGANVERADALRIVDWCLEAGANVDEPFLSGFHLYACRKFNSVNWVPTILDHTYFVDRDIYCHLVSHSEKFKTELTRPGIHSSASEGIDSLRKYLLSRPSHLPTERDNFLGICLAEEFLGQEEGNLDFNVIHTLLNYDLGLQKFRVDLSPSIMLYHVVAAAGKQGLHPAIHPILNILTRKGARITARTIRAAVQKKGINLLQLLSSYGADVGEQGASALCMAARLDNYDAVDWLLSMGVDINTTVMSEGEEKTIIAFAQMYSKEYFRSEPQVIQPPVHKFASCEMLEHLLSRNAKPRRNLSDTSSYNLILSVINDGLLLDDATETLRRVQCLLDAESLADNASSIKPSLLEACFPPKGYVLDPNDISKQTDLSIMELLLERGISVRHSGVLALLILYNRPHNEIQRILDSGIDINAYSGEGVEEWDAYRHYTPIQAAAVMGCLELVQFLMHKGADVNRQAKGQYGRTALQAACELHTEGEIEHRNKMKLIKFLITNGADVNAPAAYDGGVTAFQAAAMDGNFEVALLLLDNGAEINAPPAEEGGFCALDGAVDRENLDMVQFLLNIGALSSKRGESGYRGAIEWAEDDGYHHSALGDMIRQHAKKDGKTGEELFAH